MEVETHCSLRFFLLLVSSCWLYCKIYQQIFSVFKWGGCLLLKVFEIFPQEETLFSFFHFACWVRSMFRNQPCSFFLPNMNLTLFSLTTPSYLSPHSGSFSSLRLWHQSSKSRLLLLVSVGVLFSLVHHKSYHTDAFLSRLCLLYFEEQLLLLGCFQFIGYCPKSTSYLFRSPNTGFRSFSGFFLLSFVKLWRALQLSFIQCLFSYNPPQFFLTWRYFELCHSYGTSFLVQGCFRCGKGVGRCLGVYFSFHKLLLINSILIT